jgi:tetratricopeptide (TPR) repeat protein
VVPLQSPLYPIILRCLEKEPSRRYQSFRELRQDLEPILKKSAGETIDAHPVEHLKAWELYNKAYSLSSLGHLDEAIGYYDKVLESEPENADAWNNKGVCLRKLGKLDEALACFTSATALSKENASAWGNRGNCLYALGRNEEAITDLAKAISRDAKNEVVWLNKGMAEERLGRKADAARSYASFLSLNPVQYSAHVPFAKKRIAELSAGGTHTGRPS